MHQGRRRQPGMGLMLLFYQLFGVIGIENIPPITLGCISLHVAIFLRLFKLPWHSASEVCISVYKVWRRKEYLRLIYGAFEHGDDWHLYYNMFSFAIKGRSLERRFGSIKFLYVISCFTVLTNIVLVALNVLASKHFGYSEQECAIGFSGVIFALKVLTTHHDSNYAQNIMGIPIVLPARYAVWVELILIQIMIPNVSFFGHLAGVLVGMAYVTGPLKYVMDLIYSCITGVISPPAQPRFTPRSERSGYASNEQFSSFVPPGMSEEEQVRRAMEESMQNASSYNTNSVPPYPNSSSEHSAPPPPPGFVFDQGYNQPPPPGFSPDIDDLRSRRRARFNN